MKGHCSSTLILAILAFITLGAVITEQASAANKLDRTVLPIQAPKRPMFKELDVRNVKMPPQFEVKAPAAAPNVIIILIDDLGFGATTPFGGPIPTPTLEQLAQEYDGKLVVAKINTDENIEFAMQYGVRGIPNLIIFRHGQPVDRIVGAVPYPYLKTRVDNALAVMLESN